MTGRQVSRGVQAGGVLLWLLLGGCAVAQAQGIYTCVDAKGRRLTSDRPIVECLDREQKELSPGGTVRRTLPPPPTAQERAAQEEKNRQLEEERIRLAEEKRRDRALLARYPNKAAHDHSRNEAVQQVDAVIHTAERRLLDLAQQRRSIDAQLEFYRKDPAKAPASLRRQVDENVENIAVQKRFMQAQQEEKQRINQRFDEELKKLQQLWAAAALPASFSPALP